MTAPATDRAQALEELLAIIDRLREPDGCPWDREQTTATMAPYLIEEAHELGEAIEEGNASERSEEAGDVLVALFLILRIAGEAGEGDVASAARVATEKLVRRHPHVFGEKTVDGADEVLTNWEAIKKEERAEKQADTSALAGVPKALPALQRVQRLGAKAVSAGFRWPGAREAFAKLQEEVLELEQTLEPAIAATQDAKSRNSHPEAAQAEERFEHELGDVLMAGALLAQYMGIDAERACRAATRRFERRFRVMETAFDGELKGRDLEQLMAGWEAAKTALEPS